jgi:tetratricopeptide (TPR) repeat protein
VASIQLKKWQSDAPYAKRLRETAPEQMYRVYLDERPSYVNSTAFFLDAADIFIERGQMELGLRILSNLAEMNLENRAILRILAYRLLQAKQTKLAIPILQQVLALSPNEPQSWRDLGLAYADDGQYQLAVNNLWEVVSQPWHGRFPDVELIALAELNAIIARAPKDTGIDTSRMDGRLLRNLPLDMRAVLSWDADNTDIDLWVIDPNNEKVYYGNRLGYQGGAMSRDFVGGYGPEEFSLRDAKPGKYKVQAHFFGNRQQVVAGATTLMLRLSTGFGTAQQKDQNIILRLTGQGAEVEVGTFEVGKKH